METYAQLAGKLLRQSANLSRAIGETNTQLKDQMDDFATACLHVAEKVETSPLDVLEKRDPG